MTIIKAMMRVTARYLNESTAVASNASICSLTFIAPSSAPIPAPIASDQARLGFLMLGPDTLYPPHAHAAEELYLVLAGTAAWQHGHEPWVNRPPGTAIHHPPRLPHATRTAAEPLLALYLWWGADLGVHARVLAHPVVPRETRPSAQTDPEPKP